MAKTLQFRRDSTANLASVTGAVGEIFIDTTKKTVVVMDGSTAGGYPLELQGAGTGATGVTGASGVGSNGATGVAGTNGTDGATGVTGASGVGATGAAGTNGATGIQGATGVQGEQGNFGGAAFEYAYDSSSTADSDPGTGKIKFSNTTFSSASFLYINETDANSLLSTSFLETIDDSTSNIKGHFSVADKADPLVYTLFTITGAHTKSGSYYKVPVGYVSGDTTMTDETAVVVTFQRTGDKGDTGLTGATGVAGTDGATGIQGASGVGATGSQGIQGASGSTGPQGSQGASGVGATGLQGASGATGTAGTNGATGTSGTNGATGTAGASGPGANQSLNTTSGVQFAVLGIGTGTLGATGSIRATDNVTAYYSSDRSLKENIVDIPNALDKVKKIGGKMFDWTDDYIEKHGGLDSYFQPKADFGVIAQDVQAVFPVAVRTREDGTLAVDYEKLCALAFAAIKELNDKIENK
jgi:hypothetical protein